MLMKVCKTQCALENTSMTIFLCIKTREMTQTALESTRRPNDYGISSNKRPGRLFKILRRNLFEGAFKMSKTEETEYTRS